MGSPCCFCHALRRWERLSGLGPWANGIIEENIAVSNDGLSKDSVGFVDRLVVTLFEFLLTILAAASSTQGATKRPYSYRTRAARLHASPTCPANPWLWSVEIG